MSATNENCNSMNVQNLEKQELVDSNASWSPTLNLNQDENLTEIKEDFVSPTLINPDRHIADDLTWLKEQILSLSNKNYELEERVRDLEIYADDLYDQIKVNIIELANLQSYSRRENVEIFGIPDTITYKELEPTIVDLLRSIGVNVSSYDIASCHRLKKEKFANSSNVIIRFINRKDAYNAIKYSYRLTNSTYSEEYGNSIYIRENLCPYYKTIFKKCYALYKTNKVNDVYTKNGKVFLQVAENEKSNIISSFDTLEKINLKYNIY